MCKCVNNVLRRCVTSTLPLQIMVADLCHVVKACFRGKNTKRRHTKKAPHENLPNGDFRFFAWRLFAPPHKSEPLSMRCVFTYCLSPSENLPKSQFGRFLRGDLSPRHAKIQHIYKWHVLAFNLSCICLAWRKVAMRKTCHIFSVVFLSSIFTHLHGLVMCILMMLAVGMVLPSERLVSCTMFLNGKES